MKLERNDLDGERQRYQSEAGAWREKYEESENRHEGLLKQLQATSIRETFFLAGKSAITGRVRGQPVQRHKP